jgi:hypothetical protein
MEENTAGKDRNDRERDDAAVEAPPVPPEILEAARLAPDHWLGMVDPAWSGEGEPPDWAVMGQWRAGYEGEIEEWRPNEAYRPSPRALGWPAPTDEVDDAVQLAATGYGPGEAVHRALATAEVAVLTGSDGGPLRATTPDGTWVVPVFTSPAQLHVAGRLGYRLMPTREAVDLLPPEHLLYLNASGAVGMTVETEPLREAIEAAEEAAARKAEEEAAAVVGGPAAGESGQPSGRPPTTGGDPAPGTAATAAMPPDGGA